MEISSELIRGWSIDPGSGLCEQAGRRKRMKENNIR
jgi:hypothetical protein